MAKKTGAKKKTPPTVNPEPKKAKSEFEKELISAIAKNSDIDEDEAEAWLRKHKMGKCIMDTYNKVHGK